MTLGPLIIFRPLTPPLLAAVAGFFAGVVLLRRFRPSLLPLSPVPIASAIVLIAAAIISNAHQQLYDLGLSFPSIDVLQIAIYAIVGLSISCLWWASRRFWFRGAIVLLVLVSFIQPLLWTFAFATWTIRGFAP
jgi:hypothetical protein